MLRFMEKRIGKFPTKISYPDFEVFYLENPGLKVKDLAEVFDVSENCIGQKIKMFERKNAHKFDPQISQMIKEAYKEGHKEGHESGIAEGLAIGGLVGVQLKDILEWMKRKE